jgi:hypothetical protein
MHLRSLCPYATSYGPDRTRLTILLQYSYIIASYATLERLPPGCQRSLTTMLHITHVLALLTAPRRRQ